MNAHDISTYSLQCPRYITPSKFSTFLFFSFPTPLIASISFSCLTAQSRISGLELSRYLELTLHRVSKLKGKTFTDAHFFFSFQSWFLLWLVIILGVDFLIFRNIRFFKETLNYRLLANCTLIRHHKIEILWCLLSFICGPLQGQFWQSSLCACIECVTCRCGLQSPIVPAIHLLIMLGKSSLFLPTFVSFSYGLQKEES